MASIFRRDGCWVVKWKDAAGSWRTKRTACSTKDEAKRFAHRLEHQAEQQGEGLEARPSDSTMTLAELCRWWLKHHCPKASVEIATRRLERHVCAHALGATALPAVSSERLDGLLVDQRRPDGSAAAPATINRTRADLHSIFERARKAKLWTGPNPVADVESRRVPKRAYALLRAEEVAVLLPHVEASWRNFFAAALWTGMRKGELCGLLKSDVDLRGRTIIVARSYDAETTKGGHADALPIADPLVPYLDDAIRRSPSQFVFPGTGGAMRTKESDPEKVLRRALVRAAEVNPVDAQLRAALGGESTAEGAAIARGLIDGWEHVCRRCVARGAPELEHTTRHPDSAERRCTNVVRCTNLVDDVAVCGAKLWPRAVPRAGLRFHDLRHTAATLLLRAKVDPYRVQRILRHSSVGVTTGIYGHLVVEDLREAINSLPAGPAAPVFEDVRGAPVVRKLKGRSRSASRAANSSATPEAYRVGPGGFEPPTPTVSTDVGRSDSLPSAVTASHVLDNTARAVEAVQQVRAETKPSVTPRGAPVVRPVVRPLLTVAEVAAVLRVSTATVYAMVERGQLEHVRVLNAIRFQAVALEKFLGK